MKTAMMLLGAASVALADEQVWCVAPPLYRGQPLPSFEKGSNMEFRGTYRDLSLYLRPKSEASFMGGACKEFAAHQSENNGLWVLEFDYADHMQLAKEASQKEGLDVLAWRNKTIVVNGGEAVPDRLGFDACGSEVNKRVISVPPTPVLGPKPYTAAEKAIHQKYLANVNADVVAALDTVTEEYITKTIEHLQEYNSRNSYTGSELEDATAWLAKQYEAFGLTVERQHFRADMADNVIATFPGQGPEPHIVVVGAHSDSRSTRNTDPLQRAPGADDNGSGTTALLCLANALKETGIKLTHTLVLMSFTGEEQGLLGSRAIAKEYVEKKIPVDHMVNGDMLGYRLPGEQPTLAYMDRFSAPEATLYSMEIVHQYVPGLKTGITTGCCSDQQSFHENGFRSVGLFEHPGSAVLYPKYHKSDDLLTFLDTTQLVLETRAMLATALVMAEPL
eukprot:TRINITY_DN3877_c0_g2_i1.p1 TRINITY_DN3877_c0_g2~~TRINITY_DN3877_c0_g2_i1.p1  ORF type:complete len:448 (+),score=121.76 TRINITY_DN3877_c0_g2_i1:42-1385(+)